MIRRANQRWFALLSYRKFFGANELARFFLIIIKTFRLKFIVE